MHVAEKTAARELIDEHCPTGLLLADHGYDSGPLYDCVNERGATLLTSLGQNAGRGHRPQLKARVLAKSLWGCGGEALYRRRNAIERFFGQLSAFGGFVRTPARLAIRASQDISMVRKNNRGEPPPRGFPVTTAVKIMPGRPMETDNK